MIQQQNMKIDMILQKLQTKEAQFDLFIQMPSVYSNKLESLLENATSLHIDFKNNVERSKIA